MCQRETVHQCWVQMTEYLCVYQNGYSVRLGNYRSINSSLLGRMVTSKGVTLVVLWKSLTRERTNDRDLFLSFAVLPCGANNISDMSFAMFTVRDRYMLLLVNVSEHTHTEFIVEDDWFRNGSLTVETLQGVSDAMSVGVCIYAQWGT